MSQDTNDINQSPTAVPQTPSRRTNASEQEEPTPPSSDTLTSKRTFSTDSDGETIAPPHPFLAYARRVRSFSSPLKVNRARYLLTFVDADAAQEWWKLMQQEFPDSVRESAQLFSFKSDRVPARAWENPRFTHLKDKWTFRQLDDKENHVLSDNKTMAERPARPSKRGSLMRMLSTPQLGTIGETQQQSPQLPELSSPAKLPDDPFAAPTPPRSVENTIDLAELNRTLDRMQMMMNQTQLRIDVLAERQQMYVDSLDRMQSALEANSTHIQALATQHQAGAITTKNMRSAIESNASHMRAVFERQAHDTDRVERIDLGLQDYGRRIDQVAETQRVSQSDARELKYSVGQTAERVQAILNRQTSGEEKLDAIMVSLEQSSNDRKSSSHRSATPAPSAGGLQRLQTAIEQQSVQIAGLITAQKASNKHAQKMQASLDQIPEIQERRTTEKVAEIQLTQAIQFEDLKREMAKLFDEKIQMLQQSQDSAADRITKKLTAIKTNAAPPKPQIIQCNHDVAPPPRKMNREMLGYWYKPN